MNEKANNDSEPAEALRPEAADCTLINNQADRGKSHKSGYYFKIGACKSAVYPLNND